MFANRQQVAAIFLAVVVVIAAACVGQETPSPSGPGVHTPPHTPTPAAAVETPIATASVGATTVASESAAASPGAGSEPTGVPVSATADLCSLLAPGDFTAAGVTGTAAPTINTDEAGGHYCVYAGKSGATGGVELDAFVGDPVATYQTIEDETGTLTDVSSTDLPGADQAGVNLNAPGGAAAIVVRSGQLSFDIWLPAGPAARSQLIALSALVLQRGSALT